jgi:hypothetical protein
MDIPELVNASVILDASALAKIRDAKGVERWVPLRCLRLKCWNPWAIKKRFKLAWMVFTGKADALIWEA